MSKPQQHGYNTSIVGLLAALRGTTAKIRSESKCHRLVAWRRVAAFFSVEATNSRMRAPDSCGKIDRMLVSAEPCALLWPAAMIIWGPGFAASKHKHHCVQLVMALQKELRVRAEPGRKWIACGAALVRPDAPHELDATGIQLLLVFVEAESDLGAGLLEKLESDITVIEDATVSDWRRHLGDPATLTGDRVEPWIRNHLLPDRRMPKIHPAVRRVLRILREEIGTGNDVSLRRIAEITGLSASRFMHVFTASVGVPLRPYILWLRLQLACGEMMRGASITGAAQRSGFSDAAHLTRTLRRMLGMTPGELIRRRAPVRASFASLD